MAETLDRLTRRADYLRLGQSGLKAVTPAFVLQAAPSKDGVGAVSVGFTASRKVGKAVDRNRARRRLKELARLYLGQWASDGTDYVLIARGAAVDRPFSALIKDLRWAVSKIERKRAEAA